MPSVRSSPLPATTRAVQGPKGLCEQLARAREFESGGQTGSVRELLEPAISGQRSNHGARQSG